MKLGVTRMPEVVNRQLANKILFSFKIISNFV